MKKLSVALVISLILLLCLSACGGKPDNISDTAYKVGIAALETLDEYLDKEIDYQTLTKRLDRYSEELNGHTSGNDANVGHYIVMAGYEALEREYNTGSLAKITEYRNELAKALGEPKRK